jgi:hypothetical protein
MTLTINRDFEQLYPSDLFMETHVLFEERTDSSNVIFKKSSSSEG